MYSSATFNQAWNIGDHILLVNAGEMHWRVKYMQIVCLVYIWEHFYKSLFILEMASYKKPDNVWILTKSKAAQKKQ